MAGSRSFRPGVARPGFRTPYRASTFARRSGPYAGRALNARNRFTYFRPWFRPSLWSNWGYPGYYFGSGYPWSSLSYPGFGQDQSSSIWGSGGEAEGAPQDDDTLASQVQQLTDEVEAMRQQAGYGPPPEAMPQQGEYGPRPQGPSVTPETSIPTVFAYRDGHKLEAQNYAIQGQTLWIFGDQITRKVSLADLDLNATKQLNDSRGVEFSVPQ
jgi:hypothetical protein